MVRANWPLWVVERVVLFASPPTAKNWLPWRHLWWGLCRRERAQAPTRKEVQKNRWVLLRMPARLPHNGDKKARVIFFLFFSFIFVFCFSLFFLFFPPPGGPITIVVFA